MRNALTPTGLELFMKFPAELGPSISVISDTESFEDPAPSVMLIAFFPPADVELPLVSLPSAEDAPTSGSDANAGGGVRDSGTGNETG